MTICRRVLSTVISGIALGGAWAAHAQAQDVPITKVVIGPVSTALPGSFVIPRFWNPSGVVTVVAVGGEPARGGSGQPIVATVSSTMVLSNGRGASIEIPAGSQVTARYVPEDDWKTINSCVVYDSIQVGGRTLPVGGVGGCLPLGSWKLSPGSSLSWVVPGAGPEAFPEVAPTPTAEDPTKATTS